MIDDLMTRVTARRKMEGLSLRQLGKQTGVAFSLLAKAEKNHQHHFSRENERKLRKWLGENVSHILDDESIRKAEEFGRIMARACANEIMAIIMDAHR